MIACDNTRTCRAAGYQADEDELPVSLLLTRRPCRAHPAPVAGRVMLGQYEESVMPERLHCGSTAGIWAHCRLIVAQALRSCRQRR